MLFRTSHFISGFFPCRKSSTGNHFFSFIEPFTRFCKRDPSNTIAAKSNGLLRLKVTQPVCQSTWFIVSFVKKTQVVKKSKKPFNYLFLIDFFKNKYHNSTGIYHMVLSQI